MNVSEARELLPWFVAGSLSEDETLLVQTFIDNGEISPDELDELVMLQEVVREQTAEEPQYDAAILGRALTRIEVLEATSEDSPSRHLGSNATTRDDRKRARRAWFANLRGGFQWQGTPVFARVAIVGQLALVAVLAAVLVLGRGETADSEFTTVSGAQVGDVQIRFAPNVTEAEVRTVLLNVGGELVSGPTALGLYTIDLPDSVDEAEAIAAIEASGIADYVQPVARQ